nr:hypothetical protein Itr_chr12CG15670 [Ipomoea trifida]
MVAHGCRSRPMAVAASLLEEEERRNRGRPSVTISLPSPPNFPRHCVGRRPFPWLLLAVDGRDTSRRLMSAQGLRLLG